MKKVYIFCTGNAGWDANSYNQRWDYLWPSFWLEVGGDDGSNRMAL